MTNDPCKICGASVRLLTKKGDRLLGATKAETIEVRVCTSATCDSNTGQRALGDTV